MAFFQRHAAGRLQPPAGGGQAAAPPGLLPPGHGPVDRHRSRATSGTTCPATRRASAMPQPRKKYPSFTLLVKHEGKKLPLVRWRTTIGGWRAEQASDGYEYFRYKGSDVGERVIQHGGGRAGLDRARLDPHPRAGQAQDRSAGKRRLVVNYDELGPGYLSAYGLVAGYFVIPGGRRQARLRQRHPGPRLGRVPVDVQPARLFARLPPAAQPPGHPPVFVRAAPPQDAGHRRHVAEQGAAVPAQGGGVRDPPALQGLRLRARSAPAGGGAGGRDQGRAQGAGAGLRAQAGRDLPRPAPAPAR